MKYHGPYVKKSIKFSCVVYIRDLIKMFLNNNDKEYNMCVSKHHKN